MRWTASDFERLDPRLFRSFLAVVRNQSFSQAAAEAALTQGAISQQVAKLEEKLCTQLFVRSGNRVVTTAAGRMLTDYAQSYMDHTSIFLERLNEEFESMRGTVSYSMPESCIHSPHFGWLLEKRSAYPDLVLNIELKPSSMVMNDLLAGTIDFGFVNKAVDGANVQAYSFCQEEYVLVAPMETSHKAPSSLDELLRLPMICYPGMIDSLNQWTSCYLGEVDPIGTVALRVTGQFNDIRGALAMVIGGLGVTVIPQHVAADGIARNSIRVLRQTKISQHESIPGATQQIWIVRLKDRRMPARVKRVIRWFLEMHNDAGNISHDFM